MKKIIYVCTLLLFLPFSLLAQKKGVIDQVAWIVGDETILLSDIERQRLYYESTGQMIEGDIRCIIPERIAIQKLFLNQAKIDSVYPNEQLVSQRLNAWIEQTINELGGREKLEEYFGRNISQIREERRKIIREEDTVGEMQRSIAGKQKVSPSEVNRFYARTNKDSLPFMPLTVEVQIITIEPKIAPKEVDEIKNRLREYTEEVNSGKREFSFLAQLYSQDKETAIRGGEMGFLGKAEFEPEFANVAFALPDDKKVSRIVKSARGYHIIQLKEKRGDLINLRHILLKPDVAIEDIQKAQNRLDSIATLIRQDSISFEAAAYYSYDDDTRNSSGQMVNKNTASYFGGTSKFEMSDLPQEVARVIAPMQEGDISKPFEMKDKNNNTVVAIVKLKRRIEGHRANIVEDYDMIKNIVLEQKRTKVLNDWIKEKQASTYIKISPEYRHCTFIYPGWIKE